MRKILDYYEAYKITSIIIVLNVMMGIVVAASGGFTIANLYGWGALWPPAVTYENEWYRLFTSMLLHGNVFHLLMNMYVLIYIGGFMERFIGSLRYLLLYLISGVVASVAVVYLGNLNVITVGASGSIFGIMGALFLMTFIQKDALPGPIIYQIRLLTIINLAFTAFIPGISIYGHLGGLITGMIIFYVLHLIRKKSL
jgi:rhomboid protease GluP